VLNSNHALNLHRFGDTATSRPKIASFLRVLINPIEFADEPCLAKTIEYNGLSVSEGFEIQACVVLMQHQRVTDRQTERQTDTSPTAIRLPRSSCTYDAL